MTFQLAEHYANCMKLSAENKINVKNAFNIGLIDYMGEMLRKKAPEMNNFQVRLTPYQGAPFSDKNFCAVADIGV